MDTVVLILKNEEFRVLEYHGYYPPLPVNFVSSRKKGCWRRVGRPDDKNYYPKIVISSRVDFSLKEVVTSLKLEFSAPKLLYSHNLVSISRKDKAKLCELLKSSCKKLGVELLGDVLEYRVIGADIAVNIPLSNSVSASSAIVHLNKVPVRKTTNFDHRTYKNSGESISMSKHNSKLMFSAYDKKAEYLANKGSEEVFVEVYGESIEVLRFELRFRKEKLLRTEYLKRFPP